MSHIQRYLDLLICQINFPHRNGMKYHLMGQKTQQFFWYMYLNKKKLPINNNYYIKIQYNRMYCNNLSLPHHLHHHLRHQKWSFLHLLLGGCLVRGLLHQREVGYLTVAHNPTLALKSKQTIIREMAHISKKPITWDTHK